MTETKIERPAKEFSVRRIGAVVLRYTYVVRSSPLRIIGLIYEAFLSAVLWGLITSFYITNSNWLAQSAGLLLGAVLLWMVFGESSYGATVLLVEEL